MGADHEPGFPPPGSVSGDGGAATPSQTIQRGDANLSRALLVEAMPGTPAPKRVNLPAVDVRVCFVESPGCQIEAHKYQRSSPLQTPRFRISIPIGACLQVCVAPAECEATNGQRGFRGTKWCCRQRRYFAVVADRRPFYRLPGYTRHDSTRRHTSISTNAAYCCQPACSASTSSSSCGAQKPAFASALVGSAVVSIENMCFVRATPQVCNKHATTASRFF